MRGLALAVLLPACVTIEVPLRWDVLDPQDGTYMVHELVPFEDATLSIDRDHRSVWLAERTPGRVARGVRRPAEGDLVTVRTWRGDIPGRVLAAGDTSAVLVLSEPAWKGMSGSGAWYDDDTIAGTVKTRSRPDPRLVRIDFPPPRPESRR